MKRILPLLLAITIIFLGCGGGSKDSSTTTEKKAEPKKTEVKKELVVTMKIGEEELKFSKASLRWEARTPADKTTKYSLYGTPEGADKSTLNIVFDSAVKGKVQKAWISLKKYKILKSEVIIESFKGERSKVSAVKGTFSGQLRKIEENGFLPTGDIINFSGTFVK